MSYFNYHAKAISLINEGKLTGWYYTKRHNKISPALILLFNDVKHPIMPIRQERFAEYEKILPDEKHLKDLL